MPIHRNKYPAALLFIVLTFISCHPQKEIVNDHNAVDSVTVHKTIPGSLAMSPGTFDAVAEVISVTKQQDSLTQQQSYKTNLLIRSITGRGSSLIEIVVAGDTINCSWPTYHANDKQLAEDIANKKLMEAIISERPARGMGNTVFIIQSYHFK